MRATLELTIIYLPSLMLMSSGLRLPSKAKERLLYWIAERTDAVASSVHKHIAHELDSLIERTA